MKRARLVGEELCRTFTTNNLIIETNNTIPTMDIETERQLMELKRKMAEVRIEITLYNVYIRYLRYKLSLAIHYL